MSDPLRPTERFSDCAYAYVKHRPGYPPEAIDAVLHGLGDPKALVVADIGAGTGISSRLLAHRGARVIAVEPNRAMSEVAEAHPRIEWREGNAERTNLPDRSVDLVTAFQAFHWFATAQAFAEFRRIARRRAALVQYERDENDDFTREYGDVVRAFATDDTEGLRLHGMEAFSRFAAPEAHQAEFVLRHTLTLDGLLGLAASSSYLPKDGPQAEAMRDRIRTLFQRHAATDRTTTMLRRVYVITAEFA